VQGINGRGLRHSFNLPWYFLNADELRKALEKCGVSEKAFLGKLIMSHTVITCQSMFYFKIGGLFGIF